MSPRPLLTRWGICHTSYFSDELPQLITRMFSLATVRMYGKPLAHCLPETGLLCYHVK
jgi:hypothetical protein